MTKGSLKPLPTPKGTPMPNPSPVWLVTGASGGLGLALVRQLLAAGHRVAATTRNADKLAAAVGDSENLLALTMALTDEADIKRGIAGHHRTFRPHRRYREQRRLHPCRRD